MKIKTTKFVTSGTKKEHFPTDDYPQVVFCGRSNVGKSSLINALVNRKNLARTSANPGKTQTINFFLINEEFYLVDVPGYGYARVNKEKKASFGMMIENYLKDNPNLKIVFLLVDYRHDPTNDDIVMYDYLKSFGLRVCVVATKEDKVKNKDLVKNKNNIYSLLKITNDDLFIRSSSEEKKGIDEILSVIEDCLK